MLLIMPLLQTYRVLIRVIKLCLLRCQLVTFMLGLKMPLNPLIPIRKWERNLLELMLQALEVRQGLTLVIKRISQEMQQD